MSRNERQLSIKLLESHFNLEDAMRLTQNEVNLLAEIDAEAIQEPIPDTDKTAEERFFEQRLLARLIAHAQR